MSFARDINAFNARLRRKVNTLATEVVDEVFRSVVHGSEITGAPGQPVDTGTLRDSWQREQIEQHIVRITSTDVREKVASIEYNWRGATLRSRVGGWHSVRLTHLGFNRIVKVVNARIR